MTAFLALVASNVSLADASFQGGKHYSPIIPAQAPRDLPEGKVLVTEFFWYGCPHCYDFEPTLKEWLKTKPENVVFQRIPAIFNKGWVIHAKAYYTAEMLGIVDKVHQPIFDAIHKDKKSLRTAEAITAFMAEKSGVDQKVLLETINSFAVETQSRQAIRAGRLHGLRGVPAVTVNGRYLTSARQAGSHSAMTDVMNFLVTKETARK